MQTNSGHGSANERQRAVRSTRRRSSNSEGTDKHYYCTVAEIVSIGTSGGDPITSPLCKKVAPTRILDEHKKLPKLQRNHVSVKGKLSAQRIELVPLESISYVCKSCYNTLMLSGAGAKKRQDGWVKRLSQRAVSSMNITPYCSVHRRSIEECPGGRASPAHYMMLREDPIIVAEQQAVLKVLYGVDVCVTSGFLI